MHKQTTHPQAAQAAHPPPAPVEDECVNADEDCKCDAFGLEGDYQLPSGNDINAVRDMKLSALIAAKWGQLARDALEVIDFLQIWDDEQLDIVGGSIGAGVALPTVALEILAGAAATAVGGPLSAYFAGDSETVTTVGDADSLDGEEVQEDVVPSAQAPKKSKK
jgi:dienelactone hydrolase